MPRTNQSLPSVCLYIRVTENGRRRYERVHRRNPQLKGGVYCLHFYENGKRRWATVGTDLNARATPVWRRNLISSSILPSPNHHALRRRRSRHFERHLPQRSPKTGH